MPLLLFPFLACALLLQIWCDPLDLSRPHRQPRKEKP
jgi:hypothetical protein